MAAIFKIVFGDNSVADCPNSVIFCNRQGEQHGDRGHMPEALNFKNSRWRKAAIL